MKTILVVDDDPTIVKLLENLLSNRGYKVIDSNDGLDAMVKVKASKPDLILLDVMMPEINGYDVCRNLKFDPSYKDIPIILLTARNQELDSRIGQMMGIDYMQKPIDSLILMSKVQGILGS